jgi:branched chain amino acid efflux pump
MRWAAVMGLCAGAYALKAIGVVLADRVGAEAAGRWSLDVVVVPVLAGLIIVQTLDGGERIVFDARGPAVLVAAVLTWRRAPLLVVVLAAAATAALLRLAGL